MIKDNNITEKCFWLSFVDTENNFLGVAIVKAICFLDAVAKTWALNINPGGGVSGVEIEPDHILPEHFNKLFSKDELKAFGYTDPDE